MGAAAAAAAAAAVVITARPVGTALGLAALSAPERGTARGIESETVTETERGSEDEEIEIRSVIPASAADPETVTAIEKGIATANRVVEAGRGKGTTAAREGIIENAAALL